MRLLEARLSPHKWLPIHAGSLKDGGRWSLQSKEDQDLKGLKGLKEFERIYLLPLPQLKYWRAIYSYNYI